MESANPTRSRVSFSHPLVIAVLPAALGYWSLLKVATRGVAAQRLCSSYLLVIVPRLMHGLFLSFVSHHFGQGQQYNL